MHPVCAPGGMGSSSVRWEDRPALRWEGNFAVCSVSVHFWGEPWALVGCWYFRHKGKIILPRSCEGMLGAQPRQPYCSLRRPLALFERARSLQRALPLSKLTSLQRAGSCSLLSLFPKPPMVQTPWTEHVVTSCPKKKEGNKKIKRVASLSLCLRKQLGKLLWCIQI